LQNYGTVRFDTFHQLTLSEHVFGWLSVVPRVGFRGTYYGETRDLGTTTFSTEPQSTVPDFLLPPPTLANRSTSAEIRFARFLTQVREASFKISRKWENVQSRAVGLDGLLHVIQPFHRLFVCVRKTDRTHHLIWEFDRFEPSTELRAI
jgi:LPS-assembly protein